MPGQPEKEALRVGDVVNVSRKAAVGEGGLAIIVSVPSESGGLYSVKYTAGRSEKGLPRSALTLQRNAYDGDRAMRRKSVEEEEQQQEEEEEEEECLMQLMRRREEQRWRRSNSNEAGSSSSNSGSRRSPLLPLPSPPLLAAARSLSACGFRGATGN